MEKVQLIHFFFLKILIYNAILLQYKKYGQTSKEQITVLHSCNLYFIGSVFYHICLDVRDHLISRTQD